MAYKTILLHLDNETQAQYLVKFAGNIASQYEAHLIGLFVIHPTQLYVGRAGGLGISAEFSSLLAKEQMDRMQRIQQVFEKETRNLQCVSEWRCIDERAYPIADTVLQEATSVDLLVIGQHNGSYLTEEVANSVLLASPVPVLMLPDNYESSTFAQHVLVAWDGKNEVARAVGGALPVLKSAENVWAHHVKTSTDENIVMDSNLRDLAGNLSRHGVDVEISQSVAEKKDVGKAVFDVAKDRGADCVVMGAYGHSKIRSLFLGNTTDYAMKNMGIPLILWH